MGAKVKYKSIDQIWNYRKTFFSSLTPSTELSEQSAQFNEFRTKWINRRCSEIESSVSLATLNDTQQQMIQILCNGPRFSAEQSNQLCQVLYKMQEIFTETQICLPKHFDVCVNLDQIWAFTYVKVPGGQIEQLDLKDVAPKKYKIILKKRALI